jgi:hypothetical protein
MALTPEAIRALDDTDFAETFINNPVTRTRLTGLQRNVEQAFPEKS